MKYKCKVLEPKFREIVDQYVSLTVSDRLNTEQKRMAKEAEWDRLRMFWRGTLQSTSEAYSPAILAARWAEYVKQNYKRVAIPKVVEREYEVVRCNSDGVDCIDYFGIVMPIDQIDDILTYEKVESL